MNHAGNKNELSPIRAYVPTTPFPSFLSFFPSFLLSPPWRSQALTGFPRWRENRLALFLSTRSLGSSFARCVRRINPSPTTISQLACIIARKKDRKMQMWAKNFTSYLFFRSEYFHIFRGKRDNYFLPIPSRNRWKTYEKCESINDPVGRSPISNCPPGVFLEGRKFDGGESYWISIRPLFIQILIAVNTYSIPKNCVSPRIRIVERVWQSSDLLLFGKSFSSLGISKWKEIW